MAIPWEAAISALYELLKLVNKDQSEKFEQEWENDKQKIIKCLQDGDADCINQYIAKYFDL